MARHGDRQIGSVVYSPTDNSVYFTRSMTSAPPPRTCGDVGGGVFRVTLTDGVEREVVQLPPGHGASEISVSPDGQFLAYEEGDCSSDGSPAQLVLRDLAAGSERRWPEATGKYGFLRPIAGPRGRWVAYGLGGPDGFYRLRRIEPTGPARTLQDGTVWPGLTGECGEGGSWGWGGDALLEPVDQVLTTCSLRVGFHSYGGVFHQAFQAPRREDGLSGPWYIETDASGQHVVFGRDAGHHAVWWYRWSKQTGDQSGFSRVGSSASSSGRHTTPSRTGVAQLLTSPGCSRVPFREPEGDGSSLRHPRRLQCPYDGDPWLALAAVDHRRFSARPPRDSISRLHAQLPDRRRGASALHTGDGHCGFLLRSPRHRPDPRSLVSPPIQRCGPGVPRWTGAATQRGVLRPDLRAHPRLRNDTAGC